LFCAPGRLLRRIGNLRRQRQRRLGWFCYSAGPGAGRTSIGGGSAQLGGRHRHGGLVQSPADAVHPFGFPVSGADRIGSRSYLRQRRTNGVNPLRRRAASTHTLASGGRPTRRSPAPISIARRVVRSHPPERRHVQRCDGAPLTQVPIPGRDPVGRRYRPKPKAVAPRPPGLHESTVGGEPAAGAPLPPPIDVRRRPVRAVAKPSRAALALTPQVAIRRSRAALQNN